MVIRAVAAYEVILNPQLWFLIQLHFCKQRLLIQNVVIRVRFFLAVFVQSAK